MTTKELAIANMDIFIEWATLWHGGHDDCEVAEELDLYEAGIATGREVLAAVIETESSDWEESFEQFLTDKQLPK